MASWSFRKMRGEAFSSWRPIRFRRENSSRDELMKGAYLRDVFESYGVL